ncbi:MAG TPA: cob(I)yrinic acid a,c-diamide adenosyltransferase [Proteobacteria bacterium]|nr:cob(I)yrinic acid a,c-diamide adenosyltransferase [bacterium BMS3Abin14]HDL52410.1 cob(I)yrinic acid a,c-diamide adenosyltransferase [Pseudomonadota bacterium]
MTSPIGPGYVHVYTGSGKGKTTASLGLALRAVGNGLSVLVLQFLKGRKEMTGERKAALRLAPELEIRPRGGEGFVGPDEPSEEDRFQAATALAEAFDEINSGNWDVIILDEINVAVHLGLIPLGEALALFDSRPDGLELILTGQMAPPELVDRADLVTEMREVKHYFNAGVNARNGIEK